MNNPLRYVHSWPTVAIIAIVCATVLGALKVLTGDALTAFVSVLCVLGTVAAGALRQAFAVPPPAAPKRIELPRKNDDGGDGNDGDAGSEVLADDGPPTAPRPRVPARVTHPPRAAVKDSLIARFRRPLVLLTAAFVLALSVPFFVIGCSPSALQTHATTALVARHTLNMTHDAIEVTCATLARECADDACLAARESECTAASHAQDAAVAAVLTYADAIELAALADEGQVMATLRFALDAAARAWTEAGLRLATIGISLPSIGGL